MVITEPVMKAASSEASQATTASAISSALPRRLTGICAMIDSPAPSLRHRLHHLGVDVAGADAVDGDALLGVLLRQRLGEADVAGLGRRIVGLADLTLLAVDRGDR
jgi:hypothetical protein